MTLILTVDLSWSGKSGWVVWDADRPDPLLAYGDFAPTARLKGANRTQSIAYQIFAKVIGLLDEHWPDVLVYEVTDWHQNLAGSGDEWRKKYARERQTQRCLGRAETALLLAAHEHGVTPLEMGAKEVRDQFGAQRKDAIAHLLAAEYPGRLEFHADGDCFLVDRHTGQPISHHISDAMAMARVAADNLRLSKLDTHSECGTITR